MKFTLKSKETYEIYVNEQRKFGPFIIDRLYHEWSSSLQGQQLCIFQGIRKRKNIYVTLLLITYEIYINKQRKIGLFI